MDTDVFVLLLGFTLLKMAVAATIIWLGFRSRERPADDPGWNDHGQPRPPDPRCPPRAGRRPARGRPVRHARRRVTA